MKNIIAAVCCCFCAFTSFSISVEATEKQQKIEGHYLNFVSHFGPFKLIGETSFSILFWDIYQSRLFTSSGQYPVDYAEGKLVYQIDYLADITSADLVDKTVEQWQHLGIEESLYGEYVKPLKALWPNISEGDQLSLLIEGDRSIFYFNEKYIGEIKSATFGPLFIDIWLSPKTSQPELRSALLGKA